jgi:hypothetical protein
MMPVSSEFLKKVAIYGAAITSAAGMLMYYKIQEKLASASYYQESVHLLRKNSAACSLLGPPVRFKALNLRSPDNIVTEEKAHILIPVSGKKESGHLKSEAHFENGKWVLDRAILQLKGKPQTMTLYPSGNDQL